MPLIRPATDADIPAMAALRAEEWGAREYWQRRIAAYLAGTLNPQQALPERAAFVAEEAGTVVGFVAGHCTHRYHCDGELEWINTAAAHRNQGIAAALLAHMAQWFVEQQALRVCVNVAPDNAPAVAFYRRHGAQPLNEFFMEWQDVGTLVPGC